MERISFVAEVAPDHIDVDDHIAVADHVLLVAVHDLLLDLHDRAEQFRIRT